LKSALVLMPEVIREVSSRLGDEHCIGVLLRTDPRMRRVWQTLANEGRKRELSDPKGFRDRLDSLSERFLMETWGTPTHEVCLADRACASFFLATAIVFAIGNRTVREYDIRAEVQRWRAGAALCRGALQSPHRARVDPALQDALSAAAAYFEEWAELVEGANVNSPYRIGRASRERAPGGKKDVPGDDHIRGQVREVAAVTEKIFGSFLYRTVATAATVATGSLISAGNVERWCLSLSRVSP
jgi:hypothetical protein